MGRLRCKAGRGRNIHWVLCGWGVREVFTGTLVLHLFWNDSLRSQSLGHWAGTLPALPRGPWQLTLPWPLHQRSVCRSLFTISVRYPNPSSRLLPAWLSECWQSTGNICSRGLIQHLESFPSKIAGLAPLPAPVSKGLLRLCGFSSNGFVRSREWLWSPQSWAGLGIEERGTEMRRKEGLHTLAGALALHPAPEGSAQPGGVNRCYLHI